MNSISNPELCIFLYGCVHHLDPVKDIVMHDGRHAHILSLEDALQQLSRQLTSRDLSLEAREQIEQKIALATIALMNYRHEYEIESNLQRTESAAKPQPNTSNTPHK